jgi:hypothetical protein
MWIAGAFLCVLRARFLRLEVLRFGTAIGRLQEVPVSGLRSAVHPTGCREPERRNTPQR